MPLQPMMVSISGYPTSLDRRDVLDRLSKRFSGGHGEGSHLAGIRIAPITPDRFCQRKSTWPPTSAARALPPPL